MLLSQFQFIVDVLRSIRVGNLFLLGLGQGLTWAFLIVDPAEISAGQILNTRILFVIAGTLLVASGGYIINDYHDIKIDLVNKPEKVIIGTRISKKIALIIYGFFTGMGILIGGLASPKIGLVNLVASILLWFYSTSFKRRPYLGNLCVSFLGFLSIFLLAIKYGWNFPHVYWYSLITFTLMMLREIIKDMEDMEGDKKEGYETIPLVYGLPYTKSVLIIIGTFIILELMAFSVYIDRTLIWVYFGSLSVVVLYLMVLLPKADTKKEFTRLSFISKMVFAAGIISIIFVG